MDDPLERLIHALRDEACPPSVLDRVARRIARDEAPRRLRRPWWVPGVVGALAVVVLAVGMIWQGNPRREADVPGWAQEKPDRTQLVEQTQGAFVLIGRILIEAGTHAENTLMDEAVPPLLEGFHTARNRMIHSL